MMGRQVIIGYLCLLVLNKTLAKAVRAGHIDNVSAESVPRLHRDRSYGVYASGTPYAAYSFNVPTFVVPKNVPVKEESVIVQNVNGYLKDSYGQRFIQAPQTLAYKSTIPQQFVQLQNLPAHLSQPIVAAAPNVHYTPHFFGQSLPSFQFSQAPINNVASPQQLIYSNNFRNVAPSSALNAQYQGYPTAHYQVPVTNIYSKPQNDPKSQEQKVSATNNRKNHQQQQQHQVTQQALKENVYTSTNNGQKNIVAINSKPLVPLLDLTLLEPLKFANPIIPQVQHFLPRINNIKYEKLPEVDVVKKHEMEFIVQNTKSYDTDSSPKPKPKKEGSKKKQKKHNAQDDAKHENRYDESSPSPDPNHDILKETPEHTYEINSPNYKETYTEKKVSYNKQTQSEPVHISYDEQSQAKPKHYSYEKRNELKPNDYNHVHNSKPSVNENRQYYNTPKETPKHHLHNNQEKRYGHHNKHQSASTGSGQSLHGAKKEEKRTREENERTKERDENEDSHKSYDKPQEPQVYYHFESDATPPAFKTKHQNTQNRYSPNEQKHFQPIVPEYEEDIKILPTHQPHAQQHHSDNANRHAASQSGNEQSRDDDGSYYFSSPIVVKNSKHVDDKESPESNEKVMDQMIKNMRENEEDFEVAYKNAAYGFPAFDTPSYDSEKIIYNPESYSSTNYYKEYEPENSPLIQYEADGDDFPKLTRSHYKDNRDNANDEYFDHYISRKPESVADRNNKKEEYYQTFANQQPEYYYANDQNDKKQNAKYSTAPSYNFNIKPQIHQSPNLEGYDLPKHNARDNSPYGTQTFQRYKTKTQFVEPQYQYGFEPVSIPQLLDSEMAVMASIISTKNEKPGIRSKDFVDNNSWLVKKHVTKTKVAS